MTPREGGKAALAEQNFREGCNCSQAVLLAFAEEAGLDRDSALRLASSFGGGMGRTRELCGAVSAMGMVLGLLYGYTDLADKDAKARHYDLVQGLALKFQEEFGSLRCADLLAEQRGPDGPVPGERTKEYYASRPCPRLVARAAQLLEEEIARRGGAAQ